MIRKIFKSTLIINTGLFSFSQVLNAAIPFFMLPILTRYLTPEEYGIISMFTLIVAIITPFTGVNINGAVVRQYYNHEKVDFWSYVGNCIIILVLSTTFVGGIFFVFAEPISNVVLLPIRILLLAIVISFSNFMLGILLSIWQAQKKAIPYSISSVTNTIVNMGFSIILIVVVGIGWEGRIFGQLFAAVLFAIIAFIILIKNKGVKFSINKGYIINALSFGVPLIPHALAGSIISVTDRFFITNMIGLTATGEYTVGYQIGTIINILAGSFNVAFVPWLYEKLDQNSPLEKVKIVKFTYLYFFCITTLALLLGIVSPYIISLFLDESFNSSSEYVLWVALGYAFNGMYLMVVNYIFYSEKTYLLAIITFSIAILNIVLNYIFIKAFGAIGAAQATTIVFLIKFLWVWYLSNKVHKMPWINVNMTYK